MKQAGTTSTTPCNLMFRNIWIWLYVLEQGRGCNCHTHNLRFRFWLVYLIFMDINYILEVDLDEHTHHTTNPQDSLSLSKQFKQAEKLQLHCCGTNKIIHLKLLHFACLTSLLCNLCPDALNLFILRCVLQPKILK